MAEPRGPIITPGKFRGGVEENVDEYLTQFESVAKVNNWNENKEIAYLTCYIEGAALKWFENLESTAEAAMTWVQIKDGMRSVFQGVAWDEQMEFKLRENLKLLRHM